MLADAIVRVPGSATKDQYFQHSLCINHLQLMWVGYPRWHEFALQAAPPEQYESLLASDPARFMGQLEGEFALVIRDQNSDANYLGRDYTGTFPLYYQRQQDHLLVGFSLSCFADKGCFNPDFFCCWLLNRYPENITPYKGIESLPSGYVAQWSGQKLKIQKMEMPDYEQVSDINEAGEILRQALFASIRDRIDGNTPFATHLSGGMDSSSVAAALCQSADVTGSGAYHYHLPGVPACDESELTGEVARHLGLPLNLIDASAYGIYKPYPRQSRHELPFYSWDDMDADIFADMKAKGQHDLFSGHGGDVLFTGPGPGTLVFDQMMARPSSFGSLLWNQKEKLKDIPLRDFAKTLYFMLAGRMGWPLLRKTGYRPQRLPWLKKRVYRSDELWRELSGEYDTFSSEQYGLSARLLNAGASPMRRAIHSLESHANEYSIRTHHPLWSQRVTAAMLSIDPRILRAGGMKKGLLRRAMSGLLPAAVVQEQNKPSYVEYYHRAICEQKSRFVELLRNSRLADMGLIEPGQVTRELEQYAVMGDQGVARFAAVIGLEIWLQNK